jgi:hypothetical protein
MTIRMAEAEQRADVDGRGAGAEPAARLEALARRAEAALAARDAAISQLRAALARVEAERDAALRAQAAETGLRGEAADALDLAIRELRICAGG